MPESITLNTLKETIKERSKDANSYVIAVSGFGGSGKSTLAKTLSEHLQNTTIIHVDDFIVHRLSGRSDRWLSIDWMRLQKEVLEPVRSGKGTITYGIYDWKTNTIHQEQHASVKKYVIIEGVGLIREEFTPYVDLTVWIDIPLEVASNRGKKRDVEEYGAIENEILWDEVWTPNDKDYFETCRPDTKADFLLTQEQKNHVQ